MYFTSPKNICKELTGSQLNILVKAIDQENKKLVLAENNYWDSHYNDSDKFDRAWKVCEERAWHRVKLIYNFFFIRNINLKYSPPSPLKPKLCTNPNQLTIFS